MAYNLNDTLKFGKYFGKKLEDIICGINKSNDYKIANYLKSCFDFFSEKTEAYNLWASDYFVDKDAYNPFTKTGVTIPSGSEFFRKIQVENGLIFLYESPSINQKLSDVIIGFLTSDFEPKIILSYSKDFNKALMPESLNLRPDTDYINWAIKNLEDFIISKDLINKTFDCTSLVSFEIIPFDINKYKKFNTHFNFIGYKDGDTIIEYKPIFRHYRYSFPARIIELNNQKSESAKNIVHKSNYNSNETSGRRYTKYGGPDINGTRYDDDAIDDAFNGDPNNAWNID